MLFFIMIAAALSFRLLYSLVNIIMTSYAEKINISGLPKYSTKQLYRHSYFLLATTYGMTRDFFKWLEIRVPSCKLFPRRQRSQHPL